MRGNDDGNNNVNHANENMGTKWKIEGGKEKETKGDNMSRNINYISSMYFYLFLLLFDFFFLKY